MGEDGGNTSEVLAALRNRVLNLLQQRGWKNIAEAFGHYAASVPQTLELIGTRPTQL
jgi:hypothetical protein